MIAFTYDDRWPDDLKIANLRNYRARCAIYNLEAALKRADPKDSDGIVAQLEDAQLEAYDSAQDIVRLKYRWEQQQFEATQSPSQKGAAT